MQISERKNIVEHLKMVDEVILFDDEDDSAKDAIRMVRKNIQLTRLFLLAVVIEKNNIYPKWMLKVKI